MKLVQINSVYNSGSTGRIVEGISAAARRRGYSTWAAFGRHARPGPTETYRISGLPDHLKHGLYSFVMDAHGLGSRRATKRFITWLDHIQPDIVGLHNVHGYYLNVPELFAYLRERRISVVWTFHDCWPMTGHCTYFERFACEKWQTGCHNCPMISYYPRSLLDRSRRNWKLKRELFTGLDDLTIVTPSVWLKRIVEHSFLDKYPVKVIHNGIDLESFSPTENKSEVPLVLGVANCWDDRKGLKDFFKLRKMLPSSYRMVLVGLDNQQLTNLPSGIEGFSKTSTVADLAAHYSSATIFINPTYSDNFPTTNLEALACGTPVVTYNTGGSPESLTEGVGRVVEKGAVDQLADAVISFSQADADLVKTRCRDRAIEHFDQHQRFDDYITLFQNILSEQLTISLPFDNRVI